MFVGRMQDACRKVGTLWHLGEFKRFKGVLVSDLHMWIFSAWFNLGSQPQKLLCGERGWFEGKMDAGLFRTREAISCF